MPHVKANKFIIHKLKQMKQETKNFLQGVNNGSIKAMVTGASNQSISKECYEKLGEIFKNKSL